MKPRTVIIGITIASKSGRDILSGVFSYIEGGCAWRPKLVQSWNELTAPALADMESNGVDGYLLSYSGDGGARDFLMRSSKPLVLIGTERNDFVGRPAPTAFVWNDNAAIGALGARHIVSLGSFNSHGFVHSTNPLCTDARCRGFAETLRQAGRHVIMEFRPDPRKCPDEQAKALVRWLVDLPKPAAVMTASDACALHVLEAVARGGIKVPEQIMIVGTDNDELLASHSSPPLTSVQPGHFEMGFKAAAELERLMSTRRRSKTRMTTIPPQRIVVRESTRMARPAAMLVKRAWDYIRQKAGLGVSATDVTAFLGCSRELADLRFREVEGCTLRAALEGYRLKEVKRLLRTTSRPVSAIARECGFKSASHLSHLFRLRTGISPKDWRSTDTREKHAAASPSFARNRPERLIR